MQDGAIRWVRKSRSFRYDFRQAPEDCFAYDLVKSGEKYINDQLFSHLWLVNCDHDYIYEEACNFKNLKQQLVILKIHPDDFYATNNNSDNDEYFDY